MLSSNFVEQIIRFLRSLNLSNWRSKHIWSGSWWPKKLVSHYVLRRLYGGLLNRICVWLSWECLAVLINSYCLLWSHFNFRVLLDHTLEFETFDASLCVTFLDWLWDHLNYFLNCWSFIWILSQKLHNEWVEPNRIMIWNGWRLLMLDVGRQDYLVISFEWRLIVSKMIKTASKWPDIHFKTVSLLPHEFWGEIEWCSHLFIVHVLSTDNLRHAKISNLRDKPNLP